MSGAWKLHHAFLLSRIITARSSGAARSVSSLQKVPRCLVQANKRGERRYLTAQAAAALDDAPSEGAQRSPDGIRTGRNVVSSGSGARAPTERGRAPMRSDARTTDLEKAMSKMDMDVKRLGRVPLIDFMNCFEEIKKAENVSSQTALFMIRCCGQLLPELKTEERVKLTNDLWDKLNSIGAKLDVSHYNALLKVHLENSFQFDPTSFLALLEKNKIIPNRVTYQRLCAFYCLKGDMEGATKILEFMRAKDLPINETVFNVLIQGYGRAGDMENAQGVLDMMRSSQLEPGSGTYRTLLEAHAERGDLDSMKNVMADAEKRGVQLSDSEYLEIVIALASKSHKQHVGEILSKLRKNPGFFHDAMNCSLRLLDYGADDVAYQIQSSLQVPKEPSDRTGFGQVFLRKLARSGYPMEKIWQYAMDMREKQLNPWAVEKACEGLILAGQTEYLKKMLPLMVENGIPVRSHYFWPIFSEYRKTADVKGVWETVGLMHALNVPFNLETLTDYMLPALNKMSTEEIISEARTRFPSLTVINPLLVYHLDNYNIKEATRLLQEHDVRINPVITVKPLAEAYIEKKNYKDVEEFLRLLTKKSSAERQTDVYDSVGHFLVTVLQLAKGEEAVVVDLMKKLVESRFTISPNAVNVVEERLRGRNVAGQVEALLNKLASREKGLRMDEEGEFGKHPRYMDVDELEEHLKELRSKNMNTRGVLRRLLIEHGRLRNLPRAEEIKAELDAGGFEYSGAMQAQMMDLYTSQGLIEKSLEIYKALDKSDPSFVIDAYKIFNLAALLISNDRNQEAVEFLEDYMQKRGKPVEFEGLERNVFRLLNAPAEKGDVELLNKIWDMLPKMGKFIPTNQTCGPLVKVYFTKNDLAGAVKAFETCVNQYKQTPWKGDLLKRFIEMEDTKNLQEVMDMSIKIHGETNALYDLAFAFIEAGRPKQAQKVFDTPGLRARHDRLENFAERMIDQGKVKEMEGLVTATRDIFDIDRDVIYYYSIRMYGKMGDPDKALAVWTSMQEDNVLPSPRTLRALANVLQEHKREVPFDVPEDVGEKDGRAAPEEEQLLSKIRDDNVDAALEEKRVMDGNNQKLTVRAYSQLIENLLQKERVKDALSLTHEMAEQGSFPYPPVARFLVTKLARNGDVAQLEELQSKFSDKLNSFLKLDKHVFGAYVNANRGEEMLDRYEQGNPQETRIPITGITTLLRKSPNLLPRIEKLVQRNAETGGDLRAAVGLWSYLFGERKFEEARRLMDSYPSLSIHLRALPICEKAHETNDKELLRKLIETLREHSRPNVALAYSYLIGLDCHNRDYRSALATLKQAQDQAGLALHELRLAALRVLEKGLIQMGQPVPFRIPDNQRFQQQQQQQESLQDEEPRDAPRERRAQQ